MFSAFKAFFKLFAVAVVVDKSANGYFYSQCVSFWTNMNKCEVRGGPEPVNPSVTVVADRSKANLPSPS